jgi:integrase/recombinase XerD
LNPAHAVRGPKYVVKKGKTPVLNADEARALLDAIDTGHADRTARPRPDRRHGLQLRPRQRGAQHAGQGLLHAGTTRLGAAAREGRQGAEVPCHHSLEKLLDEYIAAAGIAGEPNGPLFRSTGRKTGEARAAVAAGRLPDDPAPGAAAGITTKIGAHTFRATGITAYLKNKGTLEHAQTIANHASPRTTKLYDRRSDEISLDEVEKIAI